MNRNTLIEKIKNGEFDSVINDMYVCSDNSQYKERFLKLIDAFSENFGYTPDDMRIFSAPGRTEIGGNHTDHQHGCVLAASINLDVIGAVALNGTNEIRIKSEGYPLDVINIENLDIVDSEIGKAASLIRGVVKGITDKGYKVSGFDAYTVSNVLKGSGMSSSAAFEVLVGTIINGLFCNGEIDAVEIAKISQFAENVYFGKPSGLMDQMASSVGAVVAIDFEDTTKPVVNRVDFDFSKTGHSLCIIDSGADHADLTDDYAEITVEMREIANFFGKDYLREVDMDDFYKNIPQIREKINNDRAVLRAIHFFNDNERAQKEAELLRNNDFCGFLKLINESGDSSVMCLQNIYSQKTPKQQAVTLVLAVCQNLLNGRGASRVHGGGFAGTVQAFVPNDMLDSFKTEIDRIFGEGKCLVLSPRPVGGAELV